MLANVTKTKIELDDTVMLYFTATNSEFVTLQKGKRFKNEFVDIPHEKIVGNSYGKKIKDQNNRFFFALKPTPQLWEKNLDKRTQILYSADISMIISFLGLKPGTVVCESGTGSGCLSTAIARTIAPTGHLFTFEINPSRVEAAKKDFKENGIDHLITVQLCDITKEGFKNVHRPSSNHNNNNNNNQNNNNNFHTSINLNNDHNEDAKSEKVGNEDNTDSEQEGIADAVFLDVPSPWDALEFARQILRKNGRFCNFSPCIEQVSRVCKDLARLGFLDIQTFEVLERQYEVQTPLFERFPLLLQQTDTDAPQLIFEEDKDFAEEKKKKKKKLFQKDLAKRRGDKTLPIPAMTGRGHTGFLTFARVIEK